MKDVMSLVRWMAIATLVAAPVVVAAAEKSTPTDPANPAAPAAPVQYESAFRNYQQMPEEQEPADNVWRAANDEMAKLGGHAGHIKADAAPAPMKAEAGTAPVTPKTDRASGSSSADGMPAHQGHHGMDHQNKGKQ
jgi:hypothetical protein